MMKWMRSKKRQKGFTLIEIMIVVLIIAILLAIAIPNFLRARETSRAKSCQGNLRQVETAKEQWAMDTKAAADAAAPADSSAVVEPVVRQNFADTAYWNAAITADAEGLAEVSFKMPENLTSWKIRSWAMGQGARVGEGEWREAKIYNIEALACPKCKTTLMHTGSARIHEWKHDILMFCVKCKKYYVKK